MHEDLQLLISHYENEQQLLRSLLDECLLEEDYKYAYSYRKTLWLVEKTLFNLYALSDKNHKEKADIKRHISNIQFRKKKPDINFVSTSYEEILQQLNARLDKLNQLPVVAIEEKHDIENAIIRLLEKEINGFKISILKQWNVYLNFTLIEANTIHMEFTPFNTLSNNYSFGNLFHDSEIEALKRYGFRLNEDHNVFYINFNLEGNSTQLLIEFLLRIFYEILNGHSGKILELLIY